MFVDVRIEAYCPVVSRGRNTFMGKHERIGSFEVSSFRRRMFSSNTEHCIEISAIYSTTRMGDRTWKTTSRQNTYEVGQIRDETRRKATWEQSFPYNNQLPSDLPRVPLVHIAPAPPSLLERAPEQQCLPTKHDQAMATRNSFDSDLQSKMF
jgi:hypothetical protein